MVLTDDPDFVPPAGGELTGVPFGMRPASGSGNGVIDDMARWHDYGPAGPSGHPLLISAALGAVKRWVFEPTYLNGDPVEVATEIIVDFTLKQ